MEADDQYINGSDTTVQFTTTVIEYGAQGSETSTQGGWRHEKAGGSDTRAQRAVSRRGGRSETSRSRHGAVDDQGRATNRAERKKRGWVKYTSPDSRSHSPATKRTVSRPTREEIARRKEWRLERKEDEQKRLEVDHANSKEGARDGMNWEKYSGPAKRRQKTKGADKNRCQALVTRPSTEEKEKRRRWRLEAREAQAKRYRGLMVKKEREERAEKERLQARREQHRVQVMERFQRRRNVLDIDAAERDRAHENYIALMGSLKERKLLHQRLREEYEREAARASDEKRQIYYETLHRYRSLRPKEIRSTNVLSTLQSAQGYSNHEHTRISRSNPNPARQGGGLNYTTPKGGYSRSVGASPLPSRAQSPQVRVVEGKASKTQAGTPKATISNRSGTGITGNVSKQRSTPLTSKGTSRVQARDYVHSPLGERNLKSAGGKSVESLRNVQKIRSDGTSTVSSKRLIASKSKARQKEKPVEDVSTHRVGKKPIPKSKREMTPKGKPGGGGGGGGSAKPVVTVPTPPRSTMMERELSEEEWREILERREKKRKENAVTKQTAAEDVQEEGALKEILTKRQEEVSRLSHPAKEIQEEE
ncbi:hypothetical protein BSKO_01710 [Bryopsis sp. KO-2023]|nr:hypothetical protein BSKO_01710 [Bryopsis sp. KO-2023]